MSLQLVPYENVVGIKCQDVTSFPVRADVLDSMWEVMLENKGVGLAGSQVGYYQKLFIMSLDKGKSRFVVANPKVYVLRPQYKMCEEGCLTLPGEKYIVPRFTSVRVRGQDENGKEIDWYCKDRFAQVVLHERDHTEGVCIKNFYERYGNTFADNK